VLECVDRDAKLIKELGLELLYVANTHVHADHVTGSGELKKIFPGAKSVLSCGAVDSAKADVFVADGDALRFGDLELSVILTPGHTAGCCSFHLPADADRRPGAPGKVFTGDALLIRGCGRTDFQQGSSAQLFHSVTAKLFALDPATEVWPAHDYRGLTSSTIGEERQFNPRLKVGMDVPGFTEIMNNLKLPCVICSRSARLPIPTALSVNPVECCVHAQVRVWWPAAARCPPPPLLPPPNQRVDPGPALPRITTNLQVPRQDRHGPASEPAVRVARAAGAGQGGRRRGRCQGPSGHGAVNQQLRTTDSSAAAVPDPDRTTCAPALRPPPR
jgi:sulfur dioxygenase